MLSAWILLLLHTVCFPLRLGNSGSFPRPLKAEEEREYLARYAQGDLEARNKLVEHNLRLVSHILKKYYVQAGDQDDLISIGTIGLIKGISTFKPDRKVRLATYASRCIENEVLMFLRRNSRTKVEVSLDEPLKTDWDGNELLLSDVLGTDPDVVYRSMEENAERQMLFAALSRLPPREQKIMTLRFGLGGRPEMTQKEVADQMGISQSYISRLEKRILSRLHVDLDRFSS